MYRLNRKFFKKSIFDCDSIALFTKLNVISETVCSEIIKIKLSYDKIIDIISKKTIVLLILDVLLE